MASSSWRSVSPYAPRAERPLNLAAWLPTGTCMWFHATYRKKGAPPAAAAPRSCEPVVAPSPCSPLVCFPSLETVERTKADAKAT
eukprot:scaffold53013_cov47-Phaeocystis_antarctica.AAC.4